VQKIFSPSDPVLIHQFSKKLESDAVLIRPKLASVLIQSDPILIRAHLCRIKIGPDYSMNILDWIRISKISDLFNTTVNRFKNPRTGLVSH